MALKAHFYGDLLRKGHIFRILAVLCYVRLSLYAKRENEQKWAISKTFNCYADKQVEIDMDMDIHGYPRISI